MKAIILCRMGSSRLPGKTLYPFLGKTILHFIVDKLVLTGFDPSEIVVTTTTLAEDDVLETFAHETGVLIFRGSATNISNRLSKCCERHQIDKFMLVLGDNPWISLEQLRMLYELESDAPSVNDYVVTPTPELGANGKTLLHYPIGTRIQTITRALLIIRSALTIIQKLRSMFPSCSPALIRRNSLPGFSRLKMDGPQKHSVG